MVLICEGISCSSFSVKELDVIVHKDYFPYITMLHFGHSVPRITSESGGKGGNQALSPDLIGYLNYKL